jgi:hypothetical protein
MTDTRDLTFQSTVRQDRILPEDSFGDWKWREGLAELMIPIIGNLIEMVLIFLFTVNP